MGKGWAGMAICAAWLVGCSGVEIPLPPGTDTSSSSSSSSGSSSTSSSSGSSGSSSSSGSASSSASSSGTSSSSGDASSSGSSGAAALPTTIPLDLAPTQLAQGDLDGDGRPDLVVSDDSGQLRVLLNRPGSFEVHALSGHAAFAPHLVDVDHDGKLDLVLQERAAPTFYVRKGNGQGGFGDEVATTEGAFIRPRDIIDLVAADFDGDGLVDLATACDGIVPPQEDNYEGQKCIRFGQVGGSFGPPVVAFDERYYNNTITVFRMAAADLAGSGRPQLVLFDHHGVHDAPNEVEAVAISGDRKASPLGTTWYTTLTPGITAGYGLAFADLNGDGAQEPIFGTWERATPIAPSTAYLATRVDHAGSGLTETQLPFLGTAAAASDLDGDGIPDVLVLRNDSPGSGVVPTASGDALIAHGRQDGTFGGLELLQLSPSSAAPSDALLVDLDGDGRLDLAAIVPGLSAVLLRSNP